ncbi:prenyltransferase/squalene oxidase repeat-containing protein, partial [Sphaerisporangium aureirubrum]
MPGAGHVSDAGHALGAACEHLIGLRSPQGWWKGELETNVTMDAEDLLLREFLGVRDDGDTADAARWIRSQQRDDGTWANYYGGPGDLSTTVEAYTALRLAGDPPGEPHMRAAAAFVRRGGGIGAARVFTRIWLALFGQWRWDDLPALPAEMIFLPPWCPLNVYDWACWARQTIVPLTVVAAHRPVRPLPFDLAELRTGRPARRGGHGEALGELDRVLRRA